MPSYSTLEPEKDSHFDGVPVIKPLIMPMKTLHFLCQDRVNIETFHHCVITPAVVDQKGITGAKHCTGHGDIYLELTSESPVSHYIV